MKQRQEAMENLTFPLLLLTYKEGQRPMKSLAKVKGKKMKVHRTSFVCIQVYRSAEKQIKETMKNLTFSFNNSHAEDRKGQQKAQE